MSRDPLEYVRERSVTTRSNTVGGHSVSLVVRALCILFGVCRCVRAGRVYGGWCFTCE